MISKIRMLRVITAALAILAIVVGATCKTGYGTICSFGIHPISFTCPLGFLQLVLASRKLLPQLWLSVALVLLSIVILGRFFCAWICPATSLLDMFRGKGALKSRREKRRAEDCATSQTRVSSALLSPGGSPILSQKGNTWASYSHVAVLGGALLSSFLFGFPVFCLVCPVGLFFGTVFAVTRLFAAQQASLELLLFPALLGFELFVLGSWCRSICPLGALLGIVSRLNVFVRPTVKKDMCLASKDVNCQVCKKVCSVEIPLLDDKGGSALNDCTKCLACYERCPTKAIELSFMSFPRPVAWLRGAIASGKRAMRGAWRD